MRTEEKSTAVAEGLGSTARAKKTAPEGAVFMSEEKAQTAFLPCMAVIWSLL